MRYTNPRTLLFTNDWGQALLERGGMAP